MQLAATIQATQQLWEQRVHELEKHSIAKDAEIAEMKVRGVWFRS